MKENLVLKNVHFIQIEKILTFSLDVNLAQLIRRLSYNLMVLGSNPAVGESFFFFFQLCRIARKRSIHLKTVFETFKVNIRSKLGKKILKQVEYESARRMETFFD